MVHTSLMFPRSWTSSPSRASLADMRTVDVVRTYLELPTPDALRPAPTPDAGVSVIRSDPSAVEGYRALYSGVGKAYHWIDRLAWSEETLAAHLARPDVQVWRLECDARTAGFFELETHDDGSVEIAYFGLLGDFHGKGLGKYLLTCAVREAWRAGAARVWLHTCTLDGEAALPNYLARGFTPFRTERYVATLPD